MADIIVIGGGIAGMSAAARLAETADVVLLEAEPQLGYHATGRSAALFIRNYGNATLRALNAEAHSYFTSMEGEARVLSPRGELLVAREDEIPDLEAYAAEADGLERLSVSEAVAWVPILDPRSIAAAVIEREAQDIDVDRFFSGFTRRFRTLGGQIVTGARVIALRYETGAWHVGAEGANFSAPIVVNAAGAWASKIANMANAQPIAVTPYRRSMAVLPAPLGHDISKWPVFGNAAETWYAKPQAGKLLVSPADADAVEAQDAWPDDLVLAGGLHRFEQAVRMEVTRVERSWAGLRSFAPDRTPVLGWDTQQEGFFWLAGQGGYGVQTAPAMAALSCAIITGQSHALDTLHLALSPARFN